MNIYTVPGDGLILKIYPQSPYNFELSAKIFSNGDPQIQRYEKGSFWQLIWLHNNLVLITVDRWGQLINPSYLYP